MTAYEMMSASVQNINSAKELIELKNKISAAIWAVENKIKEGNSKTLIEEILNFREGVGEGYVDGDYYAPSRYYSEIPGVKNFRWSYIERLVEREYKERDSAYLERAYAELKIPEGNEVLVLKAKLYSPSGYLIPDRIDLEGEGITIIIADFCESSGSSWRMDY